MGRAFEESGSSFHRRKGPWQACISKGPSTRIEFPESDCHADQERYIAHKVTRRFLPVLATRLPSEDTSSDRALRTLHDWIETCVNHHGSCARRKFTQLPKRILEIDGRYVYLREGLTTPAIYACLSHCWGPIGPTLRLDNTSSDRLIEGINIDQLPKTFADSVHVCQRLGIRFLWIDACCKPHFFAIMVYRVSNYSSYI